jgi:hypothetical protein
MFNLFNIFGMAYLATFLAFTVRYRRPIVRSFRNTTTTTVTSIVRYIEDNKNTIACAIFAGAVLAITIGTTFLAKTYIIWVLDLDTTETNNVLGMTTILDNELSEDNKDE